MNTFKTTSLAVGDSVTLVINDVKEGKYGPVYVGTVEGEAHYIQPSGNLKLKLADGKVALAKPFTITRTADATTRQGYNVTQFTLAEGENQAQAAKATQAALAVSAETKIADKLAAIRAKRTQA